MRWIGKDILQKKNSDLYYSCHNQKHIFGTEFIFDKRMRIINIVLNFLSVNERIYCLRVKNKFFNISIINAHALTEDKEEPIKEEFYETLERTYNGRPKSHIKIFIEDFNKQVGQKLIYCAYTGRHNIHEFTSDNGSRLINFAAPRHMTVNSTMFEHKDIYKVTWRRPEGRTRNQIDHVLTVK